MGLLIKKLEGKDGDTYSLNRKNWVTYLLVLIISGMLLFYFGINYQSSLIPLVLLIIFLAIVVFGFKETMPLYFRTISASLRGKEVSSVAKGTIFHKDFRSELKISKAKKQ